MWRQSGKTGKILPFTEMRFFDLLEEWRKETGISRQMPRSMQFIREEIIRNVRENPVFDFVKEEKEFRILIKKLENLETGEG